MLKLLQDIAVDPTEPLDEDNPLRQVIINTHSPSVVQQVPEDSLLIAQVSKGAYSGQEFNRISFSCLPNTWRAKKDMPIIHMGILLGYLNPVILEDAERKDAAVRGRDASSGRRVIDRSDVRRVYQIPLEAEYRRRETGNGLRACHLDLRWKLGRRIVANCCLDHSATRPDTASRTNIG